VLVQKDLAGDCFPSPGASESGMETSSNFNIDRCWGIEKGSKGVGEKKEGSLMGCRV